MKKPAILVLEDDPTIQKLIAQILGKEGYKVTITKTIGAARKTLEELHPDLMIVDRRLPDGDGLDLCRELKSSHSMPAPIMFLTSRNSTSDKVLGLKMGGDDYLTKPFQVDELLARVEVLLRRSAASSNAVSNTYEYEGIKLDVEKHQCSVGGADITLWPKEFELLRLFISKPGKVISKEFISQQVWGHEFIDTSRAVEMAVRRLRTRLGAKAQLLQTVKGYGFKLALAKHKISAAKPKRRK